MDVNFTGCAKSLRPRDFPSLFINWKCYMLVVKPSGLQRKDVLDVQKHLGPFAERTHWSKPKPFPPTIADPRSDGWRSCQKKRKSQQKYAKETLCYYNKVNSKTQRAQIISEYRLILAICSNRHLFSDSLKCHFWAAALVTKLNEIWA